jgi:hypothetical protein
VSPDSETSPDLGRATAASVLWLVFKVVLFVVLANPETTAFIYQNF